MMQSIIAYGADRFEKVGLTGYAADSYWTMYYNINGVFGFTGASDSKEEAVVLPLTQEEFDLCNDSDNFKLPYQTKKLRSAMVDMQGFFNPASIIYNDEG